MGEPKSLIPENVRSRFGRAVQQLDRETKKVFESLSPPARRALRSAKTDSGSSLEEILAALRANDSEPFFRRLSVMPIIFRWEEVSQLTVIKWRRVDMSLHLMETLQVLHLERKKETA